MYAMGDLEAFTHEKKMNETDSRISHTHFPPTIFRGSKKRHDSIYTRKKSESGHFGLINDDVCVYAYSATSPSPTTC